MALFAYLRSVSKSSSRRVLSRARSNSDTLMTVRSGCVCLDGRSIANLSDIAIPIHVEQHGSSQALMRVLAQDGIADEQQIDQVIHYMIKSLVVLALCDDLELELIEHCLIKAQQFEVFWRGQEKTYLRGLFQ